VTADLRTFLPNQRDGTWEGYFARMEDQLDGRDYNLAINRLHLVSYELWARARDFLSGLYTATGSLSPGYADFDVFAGKYRSTPVGIHVDHAANFMFTPVGRKRMLAWEPEVAARLPKETMDYEAVRGDAHWLEGDADTLVYFPSEFFHVGESPDEATVSTNIALFFDPDPLGEVVAEAHRRASRRIGGAPVAPQTFPPGESAPGVGDGYRDALAALRQVLAGDTLEETLADAALRRATAFGFEVVPRPDDDAEPFGDDALVQRSAPYPILARRGDTTVVSANGHSAKVPAHPGLDGLLEALNAGQAVRVGDLVDRCRRAGEAGDGVPAGDVVHAVLYRLASWRAVHAVSES
jgi:hypothetical protein